MAYPITIEQFEEAYQVTGTTPIVGEWNVFYGDQCCPQGAACRMKLETNEDLRQKWSDEPDEDEDETVCDILGISHRQVLAFAQGFDGDRIAPHLIDADETDAYEFGKKCRAHFLPEAVEETI